jgi:hypothetical protein
MSDRGYNKSLAFNWRGPLLAAGIFAAVFAILLLMAHQNQSNTSDMGSSLREDPYGTSLLFDSYARAGYQVKRSQDQDSLVDQDPAKTTAYFIGQFGFGFQGIESENGHGADKFRGRLEDFLARGGRVVLIGHAGTLRSASQGWEIENNWNHSGQQMIPTWISPDSSVTPAGSEMMYLRADVPWLKTDSQWTALYAEPVDKDAKAANPAHVYMAMRKAGKGEIVAVSQEWFLLNEVIKSHPNPVLLDFLAGGRPGIWVDETLHGLQQDKGVLWLVQRYRLQTALLLFWAALLVLLWNMSGDLARRPASDQAAEIMRFAERPGVAAQRLLQRSVAAELVVAECWDQFRRRSPQGAEAISKDTDFGPRLRAALSLPPLAGYRELSRLIAELHASAKSPVRARNHVADGSMNAKKWILEEERLA